MKNTTLLRNILSGTSFLALTLLASLPGVSSDSDDRTSTPRVKIEPGTGAEVISAPSPLTHNALGEIIQKINRSHGTVNCLSCVQQFNLLFRNGQCAPADRDLGGSLRPNILIDGNETRLLRGQEAFANIRITLGNEVDDSEDSITVDDVPLSPANHKTIGRTLLDKANETNSNLTGFLFQKYKGRNGGSIEGHFSSFAIIDNKLRFYDAQDGSASDNLTHEQLFNKKLYYWFAPLNDGHL